MKIAGQLSSAIAVCLLVGCADPQVPDARGLNTAYEDALSSTELAGAAAPAPGTAAEQKMLERLETYFKNMTAATVSAETAQVYAPDGILYDNLAVVSGADAIERYFLKAVDEADSLKIEFLQVARAGSDYYIRWRMLIGSEALSPDGPLVSYGVTHFRFDSEGRVLMHRDFWDAASGLYEYLPVAGGLVYRLRNMLGAVQED